MPCSHNEGKQYCAMSWSSCKAVVPKGRCAEALVHCLGKIIFPTKVISSRLCSTSAPGALTIEIKLCQDMNTSSIYTLRNLQKEESRWGGLGFGCSDRFSTASSVPSESILWQLELCRRKCSLSCHAYQCKDCSQHHSRVGGKQQGKRVHKLGTQMKLATPSVSNICAQIHRY